MAIAKLLAPMSLAVAEPSRHLVRDAASLWKQIEEGVRESCMMRCEGREAEAIALLQDTLPPLIREWSATCGSSADVCRDVLRQLFARAQEQVSAAMLSRRLVLASIRTDNVRAGTTSSLYLQRRIPIGNVPDMLDALEEAERTAVLRSQHFSTPPFRSHAALAVS